MSIANWAYWALMVAAMVAVAARCVVVSEQRLAWGLIAGGLAAWTAGDIYYSAALTAEGLSYPSISDGLYMVSYGAFIAGLRLLRGKAAISLALIVVLLGLATMWSWLVFSDVLHSADGDTAAIATTVAYPLLDLVLVVALLFAVVGRGERSTRALCALAAGFLLMAVGDCVYAAKVADGTYRDGTLLEAVWPAGALCIAAAAWLRADRNHVTGERDDRVIEALTGVAMVGSIGILFVDHFATADTVTVLLCGLTLLMGVGQRFVLHRERAEALKAADAAEQLRGASTKAALDCIISIDGAGRVCEWNDAAVRTFGYTYEEVFGADLADLIIPPEDRERHRQGLARVAQTGEGRVLNSQIEVMAMHAGGRRFPAELMITQVRRDPPMFTGFLRDISERRRREGENERLAEIVRSSQDAIISTDLDGIVSAWSGAAERLYGYTEQEAIGRPLAGLTIPALFADEMATVSRRVMGGDSAAFDTQRRHKRGHLLDVSVRAFAIRDVSGEIVGVCTSAHDITEQRRREESERADEEGRLWRSRIRTALDLGHFMFWGQPVVDAATGVAHHHELLLRMDLDGNVITPNHFLPHAENCELIMEIDSFVVRAGLELAATTPVAINLSATSLQNPRLIGDIMDSLAASTPASNVIFEITETAAVENLHAAHGLVAELTELGFGVALDDFGTGYGSFTYLQHLPVTELKIDIDFVRALSEDPTDQRLVKSIISVASTFGMKTVAEGVEDEDTLCLLRTLGVDFVQGYHIGYPSQITVSGRWPSLLGLIDPAIR